jgi:site-specific recombinase XerC
LNRLKLTQSPYAKLLDEKEFHAWLENLERGSVNTASVSLRKIGNVCQRFEVTPQQIAKMNTKEATTFLLTVVSRLEREGLRGSTIESYLKAVKNWMAWNDITLTKKIKIRETLEGKYETEIVPTQQELKRIFDVANLRTKVSASIMAFCGVRPEVLGTLLANDGLKVGDLPEMRFKDGKVEFRKIPTIVIVRKVLSKAGHNYFVFLPSEGCDYLRAYLELRMSKGEELYPDTPLICSAEHKGVAHITVTNIAYDIKKAIRKAGFDWRPYVLRRYFEVRMMDAEHSERSILREWRVFWMGHVGDIESTYSVNKGLPQDVIERMREAYAKAAEKYLVTARSQTISRDEVLATIRKEMLSQRYTEDEINEFGDLAALTPQQIVELLNRKSAGLNGNGNQKVIPVGEVQTMVEKGWEYVDQLPDGNVIVRLPNPNSRV